MLCGAYGCGGHGAKCPTWRGRGRLAVGALDIGFLGFGSISLRHPAVQVDVEGMELDVLRGVGAAAWPLVLWFKGFLGLGSTRHPAVYV